MKLDWHRNESNSKPIELEFAKTTIYLRKNIEEVEREREDRKETMYEWDEAAFTKAEYAQYLSEKNKADIDYICMETGVEL